MTQIAYAQKERTSRKHVKMTQIVIDFCQMVVRKHHKIQLQHIEKLAKFAICLQLKKLQNQSVDCREKLKNSEQWKKTCDFLQLAQEKDAKFTNL